MRKWLIIMSMGIVFTGCSGSLKSSNDIHVKFVYMDGTVEYVSGASYGLVGAGRNIYRVGDVNYPLYHVKSYTEGALSHE